ncbi:DUF222 domain-containing protein [Oryzobacter terrae]|uniref:HNH endonuclease signature motif containing protein n=1 Tax=Oryzobacter terrae TaxID=1620385 RepID=UPI00366C6D6A
MAGETGLDARRGVIAAACHALAGLGEDLWRGGTDELEAVMTEVDRLVVAGEAARVVVASEAMARGETGSGALALTPVAWVRRHAPSMVSGGAGQVVALAEAFAVSGNAVVKNAVMSGTLPVRSAAVVVAEADRLRPMLADGAEAAVVDGLVAMAVAHGPRGCRMVRPRLLAEHGLDGQLQAEQDRGKRFVSLSQPRVDELGLAEYRMTLDVEGRAVLEAALGPLSAPKPLDGERDLRTSDRRRGEALVTLVRRAVGAGVDAPSSQKATVVVTVDLDVLRSGLTGAGETVGGSEAGVLLAPETVRRLACDAAVLPAVLGEGGEVVDLGRMKRLFTAGQVRRLWLRDRHCTYPGCDVPGQWCDAHHLRHWVDGGSTDLENAGLLCERHHTVVHSRRYAGQVVRDALGSRVEWDLRQGSYDELLAIRAAREPA